MKLDLLSTIKGSALEDFFPAGWDLARMDALAGRAPERIGEREVYWSEGYEPVECESVEDLEVRMGAEIAAQVIETRAEGRQLALNLPVGPMGMYRWTIALSLIHI